LISGGSIAGPALAHWLRRFGFRATIVERSPGPRPGGQAVDSRGIAKEVVRRMGLDVAVRAACTDTDGISVVTRNNRHLATMRSDLFDGDGLIAEIEILRGDLSEVFYEATKDNTEYLFGDRIETLSEDADGVSVRFAGGLERRFDLVIRADGLLLVGRPGGAARRRRLLPVAAVRAGHQRGDRRGLRAGRGARGGGR
jgi:2-polyprenyl-6-methoxyphenol hydroxylase-like FAD-dependent oxidoreductase